MQSAEPAGRELGFTMGKVKLLSQGQWFKQLPETQQLLVLALGQGGDLGVGSPEGHPLNSGAHLAWP